MIGARGLRAVLAHQGELTNSHSRPSECPEGRYAMLHRHVFAVTTVGAMTICMLTVGLVWETRVVAQDLPTIERQFDAASVKVNRTRGGTTRRIEQDRLTYLNITLGEF